MKTKTHSQNAYPHVAAIFFLSVVTSLAETVIWDGSVNSTWTNSDSTSWSGGTYDNGDDAQFLGSGAGTVTLSGTISPGSVTVNSANDYTFTGSQISGSGTLTKDGAGELILTSNTGYSGDTNINGGVMELQLSNGFGGTNSDFNINNGSTLRFVRTTGNGFVLDGADVVNFDSNGGGLMDVVSGNFVVRGSTFTTAGGAENTIQGTFNMDSGDVIFDVATGTDAVDLNVSAVLANSQGINKQGAGTMALTGANTYSGITTISGGTLQLGDGGTNGSLSTSSAISVASGAIFSVNQSDTVTQGTDFRGASITGDGGFTQSGSGTTILNINNGYSGDTNVDGGVLEYQSTASFFVLASDNFNINNGSTLRFSVNGGGGHVLDAADTINFDSNGGGLMDVASGNFVVRGSTFTTAGGNENTIQGTFNMDSGDVIFDVATGTDAIDLTVSAALSNSAGIVKQGAGTMVATSITYTGATTVDGGVLVLDESDNTYHGGAININNGATLRLDNQTGTYLFQGDSFNFGASGGGTLEIVSGHNHVWSANNTITTNGGTGNTMTGGNINTNSGGSAGTLTFDVADGTDASDLTVSTTISNGGGIDKIGLGTLTFTGANSYSGTTTVNAGTLSLESGSSHSGSGAYTVNGGILEIATGVDLSGHAMTIAGVISPGNSPGTAATGAQTWSDGGSYLWEINNSNGTKGADEGWDWLDIDGTLDLTNLSTGGFTIDITSLTTASDPGFAAGFSYSGLAYGDSFGTTFIIASANTISGFDAGLFTLDDSAFVNGKLDWSIIESGNDLVLSAVFVPEPSSTALLGLGGLALMLRRKRS